MFFDPAFGYRRRRLERFARLWQAQDGRCYYCWVRMLDPRLVPIEIFRPTPPLMATEDHRLPRARGGWRSDDNIVLACSRCNHRKSDRTDAEFFAQDAVRIRRERRRNRPEHCGVEQPGSSPVS